MPKTKGIGSSPIPSCIFLKDLKNKLSSGELQHSIEIASTWLKSLLDKQIQHLFNLREPSPDLVATVINLVTLEQVLVHFKFTEEDVQSYLHNFYSLLSLVRLVNAGLIEATHFPAIYRDDKFDTRLTNKRKTIVELIEAEAKV